MTSKALTLWGLPQAADLLTINTDRSRATPGIRWFQKSQDHHRVLFSRIVTGISGTPADHVPRGEGNIYSEAAAAGHGKMACRRGWGGIVRAPFPDPPPSGLT